MYLGNEHVPLTGSSPNKMEFKRYNVSSMMVEDMVHTLTFMEESHTMVGCAV